MLPPFLCPRLPSEEPLGECGDKSDLQQQSENGFPSRDPGKIVPQRDLRREEPAPVEAADAQDQCFIPGEVWRCKPGVQQVDTGENTNDQHIRTDAAEGLIAIAGDQIEQPGAKSSQVFALHTVKLALADIPTVGETVGFVVHPLTAHNARQLAICSCCCSPSSKNIDELRCEVYCFHRLLCLNRKLLL
jgi:hypothetical protein